MSNIVFILGAGASAEGGCPTMASFFDEALRLHERGRLDRYQADYDLVDEIRRALRQGQSRIYCDVNNMERVFNAIEMASFLERCGDLEREIIEQGRSSFVMLTMGVLERTQIFYPDAQIPDVIMPRPRGIIAPNGYMDFVALLSFLRRDECRHHVSVISFNYDLGLDVALRSAGLGPLYGLDGDTADEDAHGIGLYKLHGSLNWFRTKADGIASRLDMLEAVNATPFVERISDGVGFRFLASKWIESRLGAMESHTPFIIPPSETKFQERNILRKVWQRAAQELARANVIVVIGYSVPPTDEFFRQLFAVGAAGDEELRRAIIINTSPRHCERVARLFSRSMSKKQVDRMPETMTRGVWDIKAEYLCRGKLF